MTDRQPSAYHKSPNQTPPAPEGCPFDREFSPFRPIYLQNPYAELENLTVERPIFYSTQLQSLVVTRMDQILEIFKNPDTFSSANVQDPVFPLCARASTVLAAKDFDPIAVMSNRQPPDHTRIRKYTREGFSGRRMRILEPYIRKLSHELIDQMLAQQQPIDVVSSLTHPLPGRIIFRLIGFPETDDAELMRWTANRLSFTWGKPSDDEQVEIAENMLHYWRYCRDFVALRTESRADDLTSELLAAHDQNPDELGYREVESVIYGLSFAGHEIVSNFIANALLCLLPDRKNWQALCADSNLIPKALEEVLRFESPQTSWRRITTRDTRIGDFEIPAGTQVFLSLGAANHEAGLFPYPSTFDIHRENSSKHISFGHGIHFCLGARLARLEGQIAIESLTDRVPDLRLVDGQEFRYSPNITFRGPRELYVEWGD